MGFVVEHRKIARREEARGEDNEKKLIKVHVVDVTITAKWFLAPLLNPRGYAAEWHRREALEDEELKKNPPKRQSTGAGAKLRKGVAVWATALNKKYIVEVQRIHGRNYLCIFGPGGTLRHVEQTNVAFGAAVGPDSGDVGMWELHAREIVARSKSNVRRRDRTIPPR